MACGVIPTDLSGRHWRSQWWKRFLYVDWIRRPGSVRNVLRFCCCGFEWDLCVHGEQMRLPAEQAAHSTFNGSSSVVLLTRKALLAK